MIYITERAIRQPAFIQGYFHAAGRWNFTNLRSAASTSIRSLWPACRARGFIRSASTVAVGCGKTAVAECLRRASAAGLTDWATIKALGETTLEQQLYPAKSGVRLPRQRSIPDWARIREDIDAAFSSP